MKRKSSIWRALRYYYLRVFRLRDRPERIAGGLALGIFLGFLFPPGFQIIPAMFLAPLLRCNALAAMCAVWVSNPITMPFLYPIALQVGSMVVGLPMSDIIPTDQEVLRNFLTDFRSHGKTIIVLWVGLLVMGTVGAIPTYYVCRPLIAKYQHARAERRRMGSKWRDRLNAEAALNGDDEP